MFLTNWNSFQKEGRRAEFRKTNISYKKNKIDVFVDDAHLTNRHPFPVIIEIDESTKVIKHDLVAHSYFDFFGGAGFESESETSSGWKKSCFVWTLGLIGQWLRNQFSFVVLIAFR